jgi:hypothetical protein
LAASLGVALLTSCAARPSPQLTAADAKGALVRLLEQSPEAFQRPLDSLKLAQQPLQADGPRRFVCAGFHIDLARVRYEITVPYGCLFEYEGTFQFTSGRWTASQPSWTSAALYKGNVPAIPGIMGTAR